MKVCKDLQLLAHFSDAALALLEPLDLAASALHILSPSWSGRPAE